MKPDHALALIGLGYLAILTTGVGLVLRWGWRNRYRVKTW